MDGLAQEARRPLLPKPGDTAGDTGTPATCPGLDPEMHLHVGPAPGLRPSTTLLSPLHASCARISQQMH